MNACSVTSETRIDDMYSANLNDIKPQSSMISRIVAMRKFDTGMVFFTCSASMEVVLSFPPITR